MTDRSQDRPHDSGEAAPQGRLAAFVGSTVARLGLAVLLAVVAIVILVSVFTAGTAKESPRSAPPVVATRDATLVRRPKLGFSVLHPKTWAVQAHANATILTSRDGSVALLIDSPVSGNQTDRVRKGFEAGIRRIFAPARLLGRVPARIGALQASSAEFSGRNRKHAKVRILAIAVQSQWRTYTVQLTTPAQPSTNAFREARAILASVSFFEPA